MIRKEKDSNGDKENKVDYNPVRDFMLYSGFVGSYLESFVLEETVGVFAVSTMEVFKVALSRGMELVKIDSQDSDEFEKIKADDKTLSEMKNAVKAGRTIIVPREEMCYYGWKGTAYIALDTSTGEGAYMISGSMCGGSTAINIIVGTINVIIAAYDLIAAIDMIILGLANPVLLTVALVFLGVAVYAYIDSMLRCLVLQHRRRTVWRRNDDESVLQRDVWCNNEGGGNFRKESRKEDRGHACGNGRRQ